MFSNLSSRKFLDWQFVDEQSAGLTIRGALSSACVCLVLGFPCLAMVPGSSIGGFLFVSAMVACAMPLCFALGVWKKSSGQTRSWVMPCFMLSNCGCICCLGMVAIVTIAAQVMLPYTQEQLDVCCEECLEYCSNWGYGNEVCRDDIRETFSTLGLSVQSACLVLPEVKTVSKCELGYTNGVIEEYVTSADRTFRAPECAEDFQGCVFPVACNPAADPCYATASQNKLFASGAYLNGPTEEKEFGAGVCAEAKSYRELDWAPFFAVMWIILISSILGSAMSIFETFRLYRMDTCILQKAPPATGTVHVMAQPIQPAPVIVGTVVQGLPPGSAPGAAAQHGGSAAGAKEDNDAGNAAEPPRSSEPTGSQRGTTSATGGSESLAAEAEGELTRRPSSVRDFAKNNRFEVFIMVICAVNVLLIAVAGVVMLPMVLEM